MNILLTNLPIWQHVFNFPAICTPVCEPFKVVTCSMADSWTKFPYTQCAVKVSNDFTSWSCAPYISSKTLSHHTRWVHLLHELYFHHCIYIGYHLLRKILYARYSITWFKCIHKTTESNILQIGWQSNAIISPSFLYNKVDLLSFIPHCLTLSETHLPVNVNWRKQPMLAALPLSFLTVSHSLSRLTFTLVKLVYSSECCYLKCATKFEVL